MKYRRWIFIVGYYFRLLVTADDQFLTGFTIGLRLKSYAVRLLIGSDKVARDSK